MAVTQGMPDWLDGAVARLTRDQTSQLFRTINDMVEIRLPGLLRTALSKGSVGLDKVDNTPDSLKPVSTAQQNALDLKADAADVSNVDNTADADKPVSTAQQAALDLKADKTDLDSFSNVDNTADADKPVSTAQREFVVGRTHPVDGERPRAHVGRTLGFDSLSGKGEYAVPVSALLMKGGFEFDPATNMLEVPVPGLYLIHVKAYFSGGATNFNGYGVGSRGNPALDGEPARVFRGTAQKTEGTADIALHSSDTVELAAGGKLWMWQEGVSSAWGTTGYNGSCMTVTYLGPA